MEPATSTHPTDEQLRWVEDVLGLKVQTPSLNEGAAEVREAQAGNAEARAVVSLFNSTNADLTLVEASLQFTGARFTSPPPRRIGAKTRGTTWTIVGPDPARPQLAGSARYHVERRIHDVDVTFIWEDKPSARVLISTGKSYTAKSSAERSTETGEAFTFFLIENASDEDEALQHRVQATNTTGFNLSLVSASLDDPQHTEFFEPPPKLIKNDSGISRFITQAVDGEHPDAAGTTVYRIQDTDQECLATMRWQRNTQPTASLDPNDRRYVVKTGLNSGVSTFDVSRNAGPPETAVGKLTVILVNETGAVMTLVGATVEDPLKSQLIRQPANELPDKGQGTFEVEPLDASDPRTAGAMIYTFSSGASSYSAAMSWDDRHRGQGDLLPNDGRFELRAATGKDQVQFTVVASGSPPAEEFNPPGASKQPTLRLNDKGVDGWVEYLQQALNHHVSAGLAVDGDFGRKTLDAVKKFQAAHKSEGVLVDGTVGNQTWSFLRQGVPEKPATDGRKPHTYEEQGDEARWVREQQIVVHDRASDTLKMQVVSVGNSDELEGRRAHIRITPPPSAKLVITSALLGQAVAQSTTGQGSTHDVVVEKFSALVGGKDGNAPGGNYLVEAYLEQDLGGDYFQEVITV